jgi:hypothetical protein
MVNVTQENIDKLSRLLEAIEEWGSASYEDDAQTILEFIRDGFDLSEYMEE